MRGFRDCAALNTSLMDAEQKTGTIKDEQAEPEQKNFAASTFGPPASDGLGTRAR